MVRDLGYKMTLVSGKIKLPFIWKSVRLITDFLLVQTMICNHLYTSNKVFLRHMLGHQHKAVHGQPCLFLILLILYNLLKSQSYMAHTMAAAPSTIHQDVAFCKWDDVALYPKRFSYRKLPRPCEVRTTGKVLPSASLNTFSSFWSPSYPLVERESLELTLSPPLLIYTFTIPIFYGKTMESVPLLLVDK